MNYTPREHVLHKLTGAAYYATMDEEYELAVEILALANTHWERTDPVGVRSYPEPGEDVVMDSSKDDDWEVTVDG